MATSDPIPILLCGKIPTHTHATSEIVKPEYKIIKICGTVEDANRTTAALLSTSTATPTLQGVAYPKPRVVIMGGGYSREDFESVYENVEGAKSVPWIRPAGTKTGAGAGGPPPADEVARRVRKVLDEHAEDIKRGVGAGEIWWM